MFKDYPRTTMKKVLLHICCAGCALSCIERLKRDGLRPLGYFYNPNIHPADEHTRRRDSLEAVSNHSGIEIITEDYCPEDWTNLCAGSAGLARAPEGGARCLLCYRLRLEQTLKKCLAIGYDHFTTTLTVSPYKSSQTIFQMGKEIGGDRFLEYDFKKKDGFKRAVALSKQYGVYRQHYCGCAASMKGSDANDPAVHIV